MNIYVLVTKEYTPVEEPGYVAVTGADYEEALAKVAAMDLPEKFGICQQDYYFVENGRLLMMAGGEKLLMQHEMILGSSKEELAVLCAKNIFLQSYANYQEEKQEGQSFRSFLEAFKEKNSLRITEQESQKIDTGRIKKMKSLLYDLTRDLAEKYNAGDFLQYQPLNQSVGKNGGIPVFVCWWQGMDEAPALVQKCFKRMQEIFIAPDWELHLITFDNLDTYGGFSETIVNRFNAGAISLTHLSDILRVQLLNMYGGLWLDATYWFYDASPLEEIRQYPFYTQKSGGIYNELDVVQGRWANNFLKGPAGFPLFGFLMEAFELYWEKYDTLENYFLIDFMDAVAYETVPLLKSLFDAVPVNNRGSQLLAAWGNDAYDQRRMEVLLSTTKVFKMTYKKDFHKKTPDGQSTFYNEVIENAAPL